MEPPGTTTGEAKACVASMNRRSMLSRSSFSFRRSLSNDSVSLEVCFSRGGFSFEIWFRFLAGSRSVCGSGLKEGEEQVESDKLLKATGYPEPPLLLLLLNSKHPKVTGYAPWFPLLRTTSTLYNFYLS